MKESKEDLDAVLLLLLVGIILGLPVLPGGEVGAPRRVRRPNRPPRQREAGSVGERVCSLCCAVKKIANEVSKRTKYVLQ